jgi:nitrogen regulatory protein P-II 1
MSTDIAEGRPNMKEIKAIIQPHMLSKVLDALHALPHFPGLTVSDCQGQGRGGGTGGRFVPNESTIYFAKKTKLEIFCGDDVCDELLEIITNAAHTGNAGDGVIMVADLPRVVRIRSGEERDRAV